ncbi:hypothetical protein VTO73DRAFT_1960 [Trametes versicolor]
MDVFAQVCSKNTVINTVEMHTGGELDEIRQTLMREPRGHKEMYGAIIVPETELTLSGEADIGVLFCHNEGYSTMCGHGTIALGRFLVDTQDKNVFPRRGQVHFDEEKAECRLRLHAPCGVVDVTIPSIREVDRVQSDPEREVQFVSVESFAAAVDLEVEVPEELRWQELRDAGKSAVKFDVAYGGAFYVIVQEKELGFECIRDGANVKRLDAATATLKQLVSARKEIFRGHGLAADLDYLYGVIVVDEGEGWVGLGGMNGGRVGACFFADQQLDRSPTGSGVSARVALAKAKGLLRDGERVRFDSLLSARPGGAAGAFVGSAMAGGRVLVQGRAFYTGASAFVVEDALSRGGFLL